MGAYVRTYDEQSKTHYVHWVEDDAPKAKAKSKPKRKASPKRKAKPKGKTSHKAKGKGNK